MNDYLKDISVKLTRADKLQAKIKFEYQRKYGDSKDFDILFTKAWTNQYLNTKIYNRKPIKLESCFRYFSLLRRHLLIQNDSSQLKKPLNKAKVDDYLNLLESFLRTEDYLNEFLTEKSNVSIKSKSPSNHEYFETNSDLKYYLHFYHEDRIQEDGLGRVLLTKSKSGLCKLENIENGLRPNYEGHYIKFGASVEQFILKSTDNLHLFIITYGEQNNLKDGIITGSFLTYENELVKSGTIVLQKLSNLKTPLLNRTVVTKSTGKNIRDIPIEIREYLAFRRMHSHSVDNIQRLSDLNKRLDPSRNKTNTKSRILSLSPHPYVFIAYSSSLLANTDFKQILQEIRKFLIADCQINKDSILIVGHNNSDDNSLTKPNPPINVNVEKNLRHLKRTSLFISFLGKSDRQSLATFETGAAYAYCDSVLVFYEKDSISPKLSSIKNLTKESIDYSSLFSCLETMKTAIFNLYTNL